MLASLHNERRRSTRRQLKTRLRVSWTDGDGKFHFFDSQCIDVSETGVRFLFPIRVDSSCYINVRCLGLGLNTSARVRSVRSKGLKFEVGLEFNGGWRWDRLHAILSDSPGT